MKSHLDNCSRYRLQQLRSGSTSTNSEGSTATSVANSSLPSREIVTPSSMPDPENNSYQVQVQQSAALALPISSTSQDGCSEHSEVPMSTVGNLDINKATPDHPDDGSDAEIIATFERASPSPTPPTPPPSSSGFRLELCSPSSSSHSKFPFPPVSRSTLAAISPSLPPSPSPTPTSSSVATGKAKSTSKPKGKGLSLSNFVTHTSDAKFKELQKKWALFFYKNRIPFRVADDPSFHEAIEATRPGMGKKLLNRKQLSGNLLDEVCADLEMNMKSELDRKYAVLAQDGWSDVNG
jgi:hypothetical protein